MIKAQFRLRTLVIVVALASIALAVGLEVHARLKPPDTAIFELTAGEVRVYPAVVGVDGPKWVDVMWYGWSDSSRLRYYLRKIGPVETLSLNEPGLSSTQLDAISHLHSIEELDVYRNKLTGAMLADLLATLRPSRAVTLSSCTFLDPEVQIDLPSGVRQLTISDFFNTKEPGCSIALCQSPSLEVLDISHPYSLVVESMPRLSSATVSLVDEKFPVSFRLDTCPKLTHLTLSMPWMADVAETRSSNFGALRDVSAQPSLQQLELWECTLSASDITKLAKSTNLRSLTLHSVGLDAVALDNLSQLTALEDLTIKQCCVYTGDDSGMIGGLQLGTALKGVRNLRSLKIDVDIGAPEEIAWLTEMKNLRYLDVSRVSAMWKKDDYTFRYKLSDIYFIQDLAFLDTLVVSEVDIPFTEAARVTSNIQLLEHSGSDFTDPKPFMDCEIRTDLQPIAD